MIDVTGWGGKTKTYDITVDLDRLLAYGLTLPQVLDGLNNTNINVGAKTVNIGPQSAIVRSVGLIHSMDDIRDTMLSAHNGTPVLVSDVATVTVGNQPRLGIAGQDDDDDIVQGIVLMRRGAESLPTLQRRAGRGRQDQQLRHAAARRPDRADLRPQRPDRHHDPHRAAQHGDGRRADLPGPVAVPRQSAQRADRRRRTIPFALLFAVVILVLSGESANLLSMGAIDFGIIVDATVIMVENIFRHLAEVGTPTSRPTRPTPDGPDRQAGDDLHASTEVTQAIFFSATIIIAGFLPLFTLSGVEGHIFGPMAKTYAYALSGGLLATFTVSPALARAAAARDRSREAETLVVRALRRFYEPRARLRAGPPARDARRAGVGAGAVAMLAGSSIGLEFLPKLEEGNMWIRATMPTSISLEAGNDYVNRMRKLIKSFPEAETVISQHGRPDDGTDSTGFFNAEFFVPLKPFDTWRKGVDKEKLIAEMNDALQKAFPGVEFNFSQYIQDNVEEAASGVKGENSVKVFGNDLETLGQGRRRDQERDADRAGHHRSRGLRLARPADHPHRHRSRQGRALRPRAGRHQCDRAGGDRRPGGRRPLRGRQRSPLPDDRAPRAALPREPRCHPAHPDRRAEPTTASTQVPLSDVATSSWSRAPSSSIASTRSATSRSSSACAAATSAAPCSRRSSRSPSRSRSRRLPPRMGRRVRQSQERAAAARDRRADQHRADLLLLYVNFGIAARHVAGRQRHSDGADRRHLRALPDRHAVQRLRRHRFCRAVRHRRHGRDHRARATTTA